MRDFTLETKRKERTISVNHNQPGTTMNIIIPPGSRGVGARGTEGMGFCSEEGVESGGWVGGASGRDHGGRIEEGGDFISDLISDFISTAALYMYMYI